MLLNYANLQNPSVFTGVCGPPLLATNMCRIYFSMLFLMAENGPLGPIFKLLDVSEQFVGDVKRGQDGAKIAPKWS